MLRPSGSVAVTAIVASPGRTPLIRASPDATRTETAPPSDDAEYRSRSSFGSSKAASRSTVFVSPTSSAKSGSSSARRGATLTGSATSPAAALEAAPSCPSTTATTRTS